MIANSIATKLDQRKLEVRLASLILVLDIVLYVILLLWPYFVSKPQGEYEYSYVTHSTGLDPRDNWPYAYHGGGLFLWEFAKLLCTLFPLLLWVPIVSQITLLRGHSYEFGRIEGLMHKGILVTSSVLLIIMVICSGAIFTWLLD